MQVETIKVDRVKAKELYRAYKAHQHYSEPIDDEIRRAYQLIAQGRMVIKAMESIRLAGLDANGFPKLAIMRADQTRCFVRMWMNGSAQFTHSQWGSRSARGLRFEFGNDTFSRPKESRSAESIVPICPINHRPKRGLANYSILWEAEWTRRVPVDPMLLRRIGKGDMWLVAAAWDLTEVERAALATRLSA